MVSREVIQKVAAANDIVEVIGSYFPLQRAGASFKALSPFSAERTPSFYVNPAKQAYYCFSSHQGGDVIKFVQSYENVSFAEALQKLADRAGIRLETETSPEAAAEDQLRKSIRNAYRLAADWYHHLLLRSPDAAPAREYLKARGVNIETAKRWKLGYAPNVSQQFLQWARDSKLSVRNLVQAGLMAESKTGGAPYPFFRHRLMFPIANHYGETIAFSGRVLSPDQKGGKYVNSAESLIFHKSRNFFGLDKSKRAILAQKTAILCEGQLDLISAFEAGVENMVAPLGTAFTDQHARLLRQFTEEVVICFDADKAGIKAAGAAFEELSKAGVVVRVAQMPAGEDPDSMIRKYGADAFREVIANAKEYFDFQIAQQLGDESTTSIRERSQLAQTLAGKAALIDDDMKRGLTLDKLAARLGVASRDLTATANRERRRLKNESKRAEERTAQAAGPERPNLLPSHHVILTLCRLLVTSKEGREWMINHANLDFINDLSDTELLLQLWSGELDPEDPSSLSAFMAQLTPEAQNAVGRLIMEDGPKGGADLAQDCFHWISRRSLENRLQDRLSRLRDRSLSMEAVEELLRESEVLRDTLRQMPPPRTLITM